MYKIQFDPTEWEPFINKMSGMFFYITKPYHVTCSMNDLKQEAWLAILKANKGFNPTKGVKFITYAYKYVYHELLKYIKKHTKMRDKITTVLNENITSNNMSGVSMIEDRDLLRGVTFSLSDDERTLIDERFFKNTKISDIAKIINVSSATISQKIDKTIEKIRRTIRVNNI